MNNWHCYTCKVAVEEKEVEIEFLELSIDQMGLVCPECGRIWMTEEVVVEEIAQSEAEAEAKMA